ncbi:MAG: hypothetical protein F6K03_13855, partial [Kamptonema sp. SIO4C4]|nr:hypothetical protein [Kamptonema sp. SIO4C4]
SLHLAYHEDTPLNLSDILVTDPDGEATVKLTLSDSNAGQLTTATSGNVTSTYDAATGVWTATGAVSDLNTLLANLEFNPTANSSSNLEIATEVTVGTGTPLTGTITLTGLPEKTQFFAPDTPYLSFEDSPFKDETFTSFYLEDFEDGLLNTPGVTIDNGITHPSEHKMDSVDADDGSIDGSGSNGRSWWSWAGSLTVTFDESVLGKLPTHVGIVKTDSVEDLQFEAFDANGNSLGVINKSGLPSILEQGVTSEDRFFGAVEKGGIASIKLTPKNFNSSIGWELDHLQYGFKS